MLYAHYNQETGETQPLNIHLFNVAESASKQAEEIGQQDALYLCGLFHDLGKSDPKFQDKIINNRQTHVDHSTAGAKYLFGKMNQVLAEKITDRKQIKYCESFIEIICYVISAHHGVYDIPLKEAVLSSSYDHLGKLFKRMKENLTEDYSFDTDVLEFACELEKQLEKREKISMEELIVAAFRNYCFILTKVEAKDRSEENFYLTMITRLYLSLLKNADILDTINAYARIIVPITKEKYHNLSEDYLKSIESVYKNYQNPTSEINKIRTTIADDVKIRGSKDLPGIYRLNLPTGAGKTMLSMRYGFHQMNEQNKHRFIYITPYLSVLEQNAAEIRKVSGDEGVLEHHSNVVETENYEAVDGDAKADAYKDYLTDTWDSPIVLSTMVQLFQTLFKVKSGNIRRFANLINSVLILDEVQSLPLEVTTLFNLSMNFLSKIMKVNVVLCTATQPVYDSTGIKHSICYGDIEGENRDIVKLTFDQRKVFERTEVYKFNENNSVASIEEIAEDINEHNEDSILVILNTKKPVKELYERIKEADERNVYHLSTSMCPKHRLDIISKIKREIKEQPIICVSTQLIEAGVDLDFDRVIRSYAGIDSIVQASGRCNREGKRDKGIVELVNVDNSQENLSRLKAIKDKKEVTEQIIKDLSSPINIEKLNDEFFERYFVNSKSRDFDYPLGKDVPTVYDLLSTNEEHQIEKVALRQSFKEAGMKMDLIQDNSKGVIVYYEESKKLIEDLIQAIDIFETEYEIDYLKKIKLLLKQLQPYTVNMRNLSAIQDAIMCFRDEEIMILQEDCYDEKVGIKEQINEFIL